MFEEKTAETLLKEALAQVPDKFDKREGAVIYDTLAPFCYELARAYSDLELALQQLFPQTAAREYLLLIAKQRGFSPKAAAALEIKVYSDADIPLGARFNMQEYNYKNAEYLGDGEYRFVCETAGSAPNGRTGVITPIEYTEGLTEISYIGIISPGTDEEDTETFRSRFMESISSTLAFGGNKADYRAKVKALDGVGAVKVFPAYDWKGAGTVGIYITDTDFAPASDELAAEIKQSLDPVPYGSGAGLAPIGHIVDVLPAKVKTVDISIEIQAAESVQKDHAAEARAAVAALIKTANESWEDGALYLYSSTLIYELMKIGGVVNVVSAKINGGQSVVCDEEELIGMGNVEVTISYV